MHFCIRCLDIYGLMLLLLDVRILQYQLLVLSGISVAILIQMEKAQLLEECGGFSDII